MQALFDYRKSAGEIFQNETDNAADVAEDITAEAVTLLGVSRINRRLYGKVDFKRACYLFLPDFSLRLALFIDSKAEQQDSSARIQISQLSITVKQVIRGENITHPGGLPRVVTMDGEEYLTVTQFVKYVYDENKDGKRNLKYIKIATVPNGMLQEKYNPTHEDTIFLVGPNAPSKNEEFRTRLSFDRLKSKAAWRVQQIHPVPSTFAWQE